MGGLQGGARGVAKLDKATNGKGDRQEACSLIPTFFGWRLEKEEWE